MMTKLEKIEAALNQPWLHPEARCELEKEYAALQAKRKKKLKVKRPSAKAVREAYAIVIWHLENVAKDPKAAAAAIMLDRFKP